MAQRKAKKKVSKKTSVNLVSPSLQKKLNSEVNRILENSITDLVDEAMSNVWDDLDYKISQSISSTLEKIIMPEVIKQIKANKEELVRKKVAEKIAQL